MGDPAARIVELARLHLSEPEAERLIGWIARRVGRSQALAGDRPTIQRLEHVCRHWLTPHQAEALLAWLQHRLRAGRAPVPEG